MEERPSDGATTADDLQFDRVEPAADSPQPEAGLQCSGCGEAIGDAYFEINGEVVCEACRAKAEARRTGGSRLVRVVRATVFGALAGALGAGIYYGIVMLTGLEIGLIAILVGFMVGFAVHVGSNERGGWFYQVLAVGLTYCAIVATYVPMIFDELQQVPIVIEEEGGAEPAAAAEEPAEAGREVAGLFPEDGEPVAESSGAADAVDAIGGGAAESQEPSEELPPAFLWVFAAVLAFVAPVLMGFENILGILIIGFGLWQAGRMNRKRPFEVSGPFYLGAARA